MKLPLFERQMTDNFDITNFMGDDKTFFTIKETKAEFRARKDKEKFRKVLKPVLSKGDMDGAFNEGLLDLLPRAYLIELYNEHRGDEPEWMEEAFDPDTGDELV